jgi:hypothetical protein
MARLTFKIDKFAGEIWQLERSNSGSLLWRKMEVQGLSAPKEQTYPRYQIFLSGWNAKTSLFEDTLTGRTWQLCKSNDDTLLWQPVF